jgi:copper chaperone CopZ
MLVNRSLLLVLGTSFILSCSGGGADVPSAAASSSIERVVKEVAVSSGVPVTMADLRIEGMSCEMMCGGSIKKALAKINGVESTEIVFNEGDVSDHALVTYNEAEVSDEQLVAAIQSLYDGQYKVTGISITRQVKGGSTTGAREVDATEQKGVSVYEPSSILLPSVLTLLSYILRG